MPWSNQGGGGNGPWGSSGGSGGGGQNPWGRPSGGPTPPDLEEMLRRGQDRVRRVIPRGLGGGRGLIIIIGIVLLVWLASGIFRVQPDEQGVVLRFGAYSRTADPGLHYHLPAPFETVFKPTVTSVNRIDIGFTGGSDSRASDAGRDVPAESLMLTGDENIIDIDFTVLWRIADARAYLFNIRDPEQTVKILAESAMREIIGRTEIQPALTEARQEIEQSTAELLQSTLDSYGAGIEIVQVQLQKVDPPEQVIDAFNDVLRARQDQQRMRNDAEAYRNRIIPDARGAAAKLVEDAFAYREQVVNQAQGSAQQFLAVASSYAKAPAVTAQRLYLETMESVLHGVNKVIIDPSQNGQGVVPYLPLPQLTQPRAPAAPAQGAQGQAPAQSAAPKVQ